MHPNSEIGLFKKKKKLEREKLHKVGWVSKEHHPISFWAKLALTSRWVLSDHVHLREQASIKSAGQSCLADSGSIYKESQTRLTCYTTFLPELSPDASAPLSFCIMNGEALICSC